MKNIVTVSPLMGNRLVDHNTQRLEEIVYNNFIHLRAEKSLGHTREEIHRLFNSDQSFLLTAVLNDQIIGYVVGEYINLNTISPSDSRRVCYVSYIYVLDAHRGKAVGSNMFKCLKIMNRGKRINGTMLTFDTQNRKLYSFYQKRGFMQDPYLRKFTRHDVFYRPEY